MLHQVQKYAARHLDVLTKGRFSKTVEFQGIRVRIDRPAGYVQTGTDAKGQKWSRTYHVDYGYIPRTRGGDGQGLDVYLGADPNSPFAFWVTQVHADGSFDEYKLMLGFRDMRSAKQMWLAHTPKKFFGGITATGLGLVRALLGIEDDADTVNRLISKGVGAGDETARLLLEVGPPNEWSGAVAAILGEGRRTKISALWNALSPKRKDLVLGVFKRSFAAASEAEAALDEIVEAHPALAKCAIQKAANTNEEQRYILGIMLVPEEVDLQGDIYSAEEIEKTAHLYLEHFGNIRLQHKRPANHWVSLVESYIARVDQVINGVAIKAGTWMMGVIVHDEALWEAVKAGDFTGFSIGGTAFKYDPVTDEIIPPESEDSAA